jgi:hypothetical protein
MFYMTDDMTIEQAIEHSKDSLLDVCKQYRSEHQAYWYMVDSRKYSDREDYRAKYHWRRVKALQKRIKEQGQAEGVDGWEFYSAHLGD